MDSNCRKLGETPYRECRKQAAIYNDALGSMERAAEMLGVSVNTLSNYELGVTVPPVDIIIVMADLYRAPQLKTMYCKGNSHLRWVALLRNVWLSVRFYSFQTAGIRIQAFQVRMPEPSEEKDMQYKVHL